MCICELSLAHPSLLLFLRSPVGGERELGVRLGSSGPAEPGPAAACAVAPDAASAADLAQTSGATGGRDGTAGRPPKTAVPDRRPLGPNGGKLPGAGQHCEYPSTVRTLCQGLSALAIKFQSSLKVTSDFLPCVSAQISWLHSLFDDFGAYGVFCVRVCMYCVCVCMV